MFANREIRLPIGTLRYRDEGAGPPIVFLHGLLVNGLLWRKVVPELAGRFRCLVPDLPLGAHSVPLPADAEVTPATVARAVADFIGALGVDRVTLVGNDTGGAIAQIVATEHPERIGRLVLTDCDAFDNFLPPLFRYLQWGARIPGFVRLAGQVLKVRPLRRLPFTYGWVAKRPIPGDVVDRYVAALGDPGVRRDVVKFLRAISPRYTEEAARKLADFRKPALILWSPEDRFFPLEHARRLARIIPDARLETVDDAYAFLAEDQPRRVAELIADFVTNRV
ncbi:MAG TPA: alpha/beta hydrolase [Longimicrobiaceae bacterium]|nr:alpha/beta hydrolase [Longimicrobiaceae bacterium]